MNRCQMEKTSKFSDERGNSFSVKIPAYLASFCSCIEQMHTMHQAFITRVDKRLHPWTSEVCFGDLFEKFYPILQIYGQYAKLHEKCVLELESPSFHYFVERFHADPRVKKQTLRSFLITPIQRVPRYLLLIKELQKYTPRDHTDTRLLSSAYKIVNDANIHINETLKIEQSSAILEVLAKKYSDTSIIKGNRTVVRSDKLERIRSKAMLSSKTKFPCLVYIFNDMLLCGSEKKLHRKMDIENCTVEDISENGLPKVIVRINDSSKTKDYFATPLTKKLSAPLVLSFPDFASKGQWVMAFTKAIYDANEHVDDAPIVRRATPRPQSPSLSTSQFDEKSIGQDNRRRASEPTYKSDSINDKKDTSFAEVPHATYSTVTYYDLLHGDSKKGPISTDTSTKSTLSSPPPSINRRSSLPVKIPSILTRPQARRSSAPTHARTPCNSPITPTSPATRKLTSIPSHNIPITPTKTSPSSSSPSNDGPPSPLPLNEPPSPLPELPASTLISRNLAWSTKIYTGGKVENKTPMEILKNLRTCTKCGSAGVMNFCANCGSRLLINQQEGGIERGKRA